MNFENLKKAGLFDLLSDEAKDIFLPQGIFYWSGRAKKEAEIDATIGSAQGKKSLFLPDGDDSTCTFYLPTVMNKLKALKSEQIVPYAPINGHPKFRTAWRNWIIKKLEPHYSFDPALIGAPATVPGVTAALAYLARLFLSPGETILCHDKKWENYNLVFSGAQKLAVRSAGLFKSGSLDIADLAANIRDIAKKQNPVVVLNFPNNPTGYMPTHEEAKLLRDEIVKIAGETGRKIALIFDDAYDGFVYDSQAAQVSIFGHFIGAHPNIVAVKCDGASKEFLLYGSRVAAITFALHPAWGDPAEIQKELDNKIGAFIRGTISNSSLAFQQAVAAAIDEDADACNAERAIITGILADRWEKLKNALASADLSGSAPDPFNAGFFGFLNLNKPSEKLADLLLSKYKLGVIPLAEPDVNVNGIRIAFCSVEADMIGEMVGRISKAIKEI
jgi:aspartate/methionine/tyrosine aminotransferase